MGSFSTSLQGLGATAHAVLDQNQEDGGNRRFILAQLPEPTELTEYPTIVEITKERVRRVAERMEAEDEAPLRESQDRGFRVFKLAESNFTARGTPRAQLTRLRCSLRSRNTSTTFATGGARSTCSTRSC